MRILILLFACTLYSLTSLFAQPEQPGIDTTSLIRNVSLIQLIATPERYHKKVVQVRGYLNLEFEGNGLYLNKEDFDNHLSINGVWVSFSERISKERKLIDYSKKYVILIGTFDMYGGSPYSGTIKNITRLDSWFWK